MRTINIYVSTNADPEPVLLVVGRDVPEGWAKWLSREEAEELARELREAGFRGEPPPQPITYCPDCHVQRGDTHQEGCRLRGIY